MRAVAKVFLLTSTTGDGRQDHHVTMADECNIADAIELVERGIGRLTIGWGVGISRVEPRPYERVWNPALGVSNASAV